MTMINDAWTKWWWPYDCQPSLHNNTTSRKHTKITAKLHGRIPHLVEICPAMMAAVHKVIIPQKALQISPFASATPLLVGLLPWQEVVGLGHVFHDPNGLRQRKTVLRESMNPFPLLLIPWPCRGFPCVWVSLWRGWRGYFRPSVVGLWEYPHVGNPAVWTTKL